MGASIKKSKVEWCLSSEKDKQSLKQQRKDTSDTIEFIKQAIQDSLKHYIGEPLTQSAIDNIKLNIINNFNNLQLSGIPGELKVKPNSIKIDPVTGKITYTLIKKKTN